MNLQQIRTFCAVMTSSNMSDAATKLGRTQPAVSASLKALEDALGVTLFDRVGRKLSPRPEAHYLLSEAESMLAQSRRISHTMQTMTLGQTGSMTAVAMPGPAALLFPRFIASLLTDTEGLSLSLFARSSAQIEELAKAQSIDFGFGDAPSSQDGKALYECRVISGQCCVVMDPAHPLADRDAVHLSDLDGVPLGTLQSDHALRRKLENQMTAAGGTLHVFLESQTFLPVLQFVEAGLCAAIIDPLTATHIHATGRSQGPILVKPLITDFRYRYGIYWPRFRAISALGENVRCRWEDEVWRQLADISAAPRLEDP
ncbi:LysR family transcriptional regulator [Jannaschia sp. CCS1]|uniref:LysR family transcriptional regulator n=1 Tax=Jannaschia sp. (strain CCS1) TaxID=290400 RepID=UPI000053BE7F|nr:LysR family transcriptional regulator [Jannaschia sp. CCS1]ABD55794.1 transcriptional regulator, LysR family [Jannaschia sp. CCS1]